MKTLMTIAVAVLMTSRDVDAQTTPPGPQGCDSSYSTPYGYPSYGATYAVPYYSYRYDPARSYYYPYRGASYRCAPGYYYGHGTPSYYNHYYSYSRPGPYNGGSTYRGYHGGPRR